MNTHWITGSAVAVVIAAFTSAVPAQAEMNPSFHISNPMLQHIDCAIGLHIGPAGGCILGTDDDHHDTVVEKREDAGGCDTKSVKKTNEDGDTVTKTIKHCD